MGQVPWVHSWSNFQILWSNFSVAKITDKYACAGIILVCLNIGGFLPIFHEFLTPKRSVQICWEIGADCRGYGFLLPIKSSGQVTHCQNNPWKLFRQVDLRAICSLDKWICFCDFMPVIITEMQVTCLDLFWSVNDDDDRQPFRNLPELLNLILDLKYWGKGVQIKVICVCVLQTSPHPAIIWLLLRWEESLPNPRICSTRRTLQRITKTYSI